MRIAFFTENYFPMISGVSVSIKLFRDALEERGHEVYVFSPSYGKDKNPPDDDKKIIRLPPIPLRIHQTPIVFPLTSWKQFIPSWLNLDIIHAHHPFFLGRIGLFWARALKIPIVYTFHTLYEAYVHYAPLKRELAIAFLKRYVRKYANQVDLVIAPSFSIKRYLMEKGVRKPIEVIPTGIKWKDFQGGDSKRERILLFVGRLGEEKNLLFLLKVLYKVRELDWKALFVGDGPDRVFLSKKVKELGLGDRISFTGMLSQDELKKLYKKAYIFIFSSLTETQGLVVLEAMASGLPVIALKALGVSDFVHSGYTGFLVEDEEEFASKIKLLLSNEELHRRFSIASREWAKLWDISMMASHLIWTYESLKRDFSPPTRLRALQALDFL
ncbi:MAG: glycosyltransferase family 4 protein [Synergistetes bacterium]|nr:glycosyltransferase family 4 protein [Synergistota bacterium]MDW8193101.1 glycosyltransferase family 4 protein [Synergistota bacterium]